MSKSRSISNRHSFYDILTVNTLYVKKLANIILGPLQNISITGNAATVTNGIYQTDFSLDHSILKADSVNTPTALTLPEATLLGRKTGESISALSVSDTQTLLGITAPNVYTFERLEVVGGTTQNIDTDTIMTKIVVTSGGEDPGENTVTGALTDGTLDGMFKIIQVKLESGTDYQLQLKYTDASGTNETQTLHFDQNGASIHLVWDDEESCWLNVNTGVTFI